MGKLCASCNFTRKIKKKERYTMPKNLTDSDIFTTPISVPVDTDARNAASVETPFQALANRTKFLHSRSEAEQVFIKKIPGAAFRSVKLTAHAGTVADGWTLDGTGSGYFDSTLKATDRYSFCVLDLGLYLPNEFEFTSIEFNITPGTARAPAPNRVLVEMHMTVNGTSNVLFSSYDDGLPLTQTITRTLANSYSSSQDTIMIVFRSGSPFAEDKINYVKVVGTKKSYWNP